LMFMAPAVLPQARTTVVIIPYKALVNDIEVRCKYFKIPHQVWYASVPFSYPLILVSMESLGFSALLGWLREGELSQMIERVVVDESHLAVTGKWRNADELLSKLAMFPKLPKVFLTGTLPPTMEEEFRESLMLEEGEIEILRQPTIRPNVEYNILFEENYRMEDIIRSIITKYPMDAGKKGIFFVRTKKDCREFGHIFRLPFYYSTNNAEMPEEKDRGAEIRR
jgi:superfamily II DNA helicase RecQ